LQAKKGTTEIKSRTKPALRVLPPAEVQIWLPVQGVLRDVQHAFLGLCIDAGQKVLAALMEADRVALCGAKGVPSSSDPLQVRSMLDMRHPKCWKPATRNARKRPLNVYRCATSELRMRGHQLSWTDTD